MIKAAGTNDILDVIYIASGLAKKQPVPEEKKATEIVEKAAKSSAEKKKAKKGKIAEDSQSDEEGGGEGTGASIEEESEITEGETAKQKQKAGPKKVPASKDTPDIVTPKKISESRKSSDAELAKDRLLLDKL